MTKLNYFPEINQGHTMRMAASIDPNRLYLSTTKIGLSGIGLFPLFKWDGFEIDNHYGEYLVLIIGDDPIDSLLDYNVIISLN